MMRHLISKTTLLAVAALLVAGAANAGAPSSAQSTKPAGIVIVGQNGLSPQAVDPGGTFTFTIRDAVPNVIPNAQVTIDFSACPFVALCRDVKRSPATTIVCSGQQGSVTEVTDINGVATFAIVGAQVQPAPPSTGPVFPPAGTGVNPLVGYAGCGKVTVTVPGFPPAVYPNVIVSTGDEDGTVGIVGGDVAKVGSDIISGSYWERSDVKNTGADGGLISGGDSAALGSLVVAGQSSQSCAPLGTLCP